jgi:hypothetical protein
MFNIDLDWSHTPIQRGELLGKLPAGLESLTLGSRFDMPIVPGMLPAGLRTLELGVVHGVSALDVDRRAGRSRAV